MQKSQSQLQLLKNVKIKVFGGRPQEDAKGWLRTLMNEFEFNKISDLKLTLRHLYRNLKHATLDWFEELEDKADPEGPLSN